MSDTIGSIYSDFEYYEILCTKFNEACLDIKDADNWFRHMKQLENKVDLKKYDNLNNWKNGE